MAHTVADKKRLIARVRRIRGQVEAIERALEDELDCSIVLHNIAGCRGAMNGLMCEVVEGHIRSHVVGASAAKQTEAADDLMILIKSYLK